VFPIANEAGGMMGVHLSYLKSGIHAAEAGCHSKPEDFADITLQRTFPQVISFQGRSFNWDSFPGEFLIGVGLPFKNTGT
jgi:hypothetical protein